MRCFCFVGPFLQKSEDVPSNSWFGMGAEIDTRRPRPGFRRRRQNNRPLYNATHLFVHFFSSNARAFHTLAQVRLVHISTCLGCTRSGGKAGGEGGLVQQNTRLPCVVRDPPSLLLQDVGRRCCCFAVSHKQDVVFLGSTRNLGNQQQRACNLSSVDRPPGAQTLRLVATASPRLSMHTRCLKKSKLRSQELCYGGTVTTTDAQKTTSAGFFTLGR